MDWILPLCTVVGAIIMMTYGFLSSGEPWNWRKWGAATIMTALVALAEAGTTGGENVVVTGDGLAGLCVQAILAGAGTVYGVSKAPKAGAALRDAVTKLAKRGTSK